MVMTLLALGLLNCPNQSIFSPDYLTLTVMIENEQSYISTMNMIPLQ